MFKTPTQTIYGSTANDIVFPTGPQDTISSVRWSKANNLLAAASWDGRVYLYDVSQPANIRGLTTLDNPNNSPFFDCDFNKQTTLLAATGAPTHLSILDLTTSQSHTFQQNTHTKPIHNVRFLSPSQSNSPVVATGSWDATLRYWDLRQPQPAAVIPVGERIYTMDCTDKHLVLTTANNKIHIFDLTGDVTKSVETRDTPWRRTTTCVCVGEVDVSVAGNAKGKGLQDVRTNGDFTFKCHRTVKTSTKPITRSTSVYTVNAAAFQGSERPVMATAGSDGKFNFWNVVGTRRLKEFFAPGGGAITSCTFSADGDSFVYAVGEDWSKGYGGQSETQAKLLMHLGVNGDTQMV
ncbi:WD40-repeat-containing domain protein [Podospora aff. communis PSN243]|uniref:WD40-repeat-containing domain protein n=1 Tax=Podospora aff. communis PSN243 TaxID=3040156 RepID=A0AAV9GMI4_9PEZI|nr:WD40-repeat-containing domain protein [Podospora aff. communis PSN243]